MKTVIRFFIFYLLFFILPAPVFAADRSNNKYGIHLAQPHLEDFERVKDLVNTEGGDWGYVTLVMEEKDRNRGKWQEIFDRMRELHLIPIIRLATYPEGENWHRPGKDDAESWANFLDSLNWVVKNRYVVLFNEPNHGSEWGGEVDAKNYGEVGLAFSQKLKAKNKDFFIMLAGLDASAPQSLPVYEDEETFLENVVGDGSSVPEIGGGKTPPLHLFDFIDGWASHSYPNPGFIGSPYDYGRRSIRGYEWELNLLKNLGVDKNLPVFITETGWDGIKLDRDLVANYYRLAFNDVWNNDDRIMAVTPFVLDYQGEPFLNFSWKKYQSGEFYPQYHTIQALPKTKGSPEQIDKGQIDFEAPQELITASNYHFRIKLKNTGQSIWDKDEGYVLRLTEPASPKLQRGEPKSWNYFFSDLKEIIPFADSEADFYIKTNGYLGKKNLKIGLYKDQELIAEKDWLFFILPLPNIDFKVDTYPKLKTNGNDFEIQIFDEREGLVFKKAVKVKNREGKAENIQNIVLGKKYRAVILKPYYLPRQEFVTFKRGDNRVRFRVMFPLDFNKDGHWSLDDLSALFKNIQLFSLFLP